MDQIIEVFKDTKIILILASIPIVFFLNYTNFIVFVAYRKRRKANTNPNKKYTLLAYIVSILYSFLTLIVTLIPFILIGYWTYQFFTLQPQVIKTEPHIEGIIKSEYQPIKIYFDSKISFEKLNPQISPEMKGEWSCEGFPITEFCDTVVFTPHESYEPNRQIIVFFQDITNTFGTTQMYAKSMPFTSQQVPEIISSTPKNGDSQAIITNEVILELSHETGKFVDWTVVNQENIETELVAQGNTIKLKFNNELDQDTKYNFDIYRTIKRYNILDNTEIERGDTEKVYTLSFTTAGAPALKKYSPSGTGVLSEATIDITFDAPMDRTAVEQAFNISPTTEGTFSWTDDQNVKFTPSSSLKKETTYKVSFPAGLKNLLNGQTEKEISFKFTTIGKVAVKSVSPINGGTGYGIGNDITIEFNQAVDRASAQSKFSLSPKINGTFAWSGDKMTYKVANKLAYSTKYTITVNSGVKTINGLDSNKKYTYTFTTRNQIFTLNVPLYSQVYSGGNFDCNIVATRMVLGYRGVYVSSSTVKSALGIGTNPNLDWVDNYGVHWGPVSSYISNYRTNSFKDGWNTPALVKEVERGNPVILWWWNRYHTPGVIEGSSPSRYNGMHSEVVVGFIGSSDNPTSIITNDPWRGRLTYSRSLFESTWSHIGRKAVVVY